MFVVESKIDLCELPAQMESICNLIEFIILKVVSISKVTDFELDFRELESVAVINTLLLLE